MNKVALLDELMKLSPSERLDIADELWHSIHPPGSVRPGEPFVLTAEQKAELDRRIAEHRADPGSAVPWEEVRVRLWAKYGLAP
jgi:putative addiction module component (TIGR02574 family)